MAKRAPVGMVKRLPPPPPAVLAERKLIVVANAEQKKRYESLKLHDRMTTIIMTARDIQNTGVFTYEIGSVDWKPGWSLECEKPEVVVARVNRRLESNGRRIAM
jgi:hypothetical protein